MTNEKEEPTDSSGLEENTSEELSDVEAADDTVADDAGQDTESAADLEPEPEVESSHESSNEDFSTDVLENEGGALHPSDTAHDEDGIDSTNRPVDEPDESPVDEVPQAGYESTAPIAGDSAETADSQTNGSGIKDSSDKGPEAESLQNKRLLNGALAGWTVAVVAILGIGGFAIYNSTQTTVPLAPSSYTEADKATDETCEAFEDADLKCEVFTKHSYEAPSGAIITQSADAGEKIRKGTTISVTYSSGPEFGEMPDVVGIPLEYASTELNAQGIEIERTEEVDSSGLPSGHVVSSSVEKGSVTTNGDSVVLTISSGKIAAPDFSDMSTDQASKKAADLGIDLKIDWIEGSAPHGVVQSQSVESGEQVDDGTVTVEVNRPFGDSAVTIPEVTGMEQDKAIAVLNEAGVTMLNIVEVPGDKDEVLNVSPSESNYVSASQVVTVVVSVTD